jgi:hypothetical protein
VVELHGANKALGRPVAFPTKRDVLQRELMAERRRLGRLVHERGRAAAVERGARISVGAATPMMLLLTYKILDLSAEIAAIDAKDTVAHPSP